MRISEIIIEGYKEAVDTFSQSAEPTVVNDIINRYKNLVNKNQVKGDERNIDWWRKQGWEKFQAFVDKKSNLPTRTQAKRGKWAGKYISFNLNNEKYPDTAVIPLDHYAADYFCIDKRWCVANNSLDFFSYFLGGDFLIYVTWYAIVARRGPNGYYAKEVFDTDNNEVGTEEFQKKTGYNADNIVQFAVKNYGPQIEAARQQLEATPNKDRYKFASS